MSIIDKISALKNILEIILKVLSITFNVVESLINAIDRLENK